MKRRTSHVVRGLGVDIVSIARFRRIKKTDYKHWSRVFTKKEWAYAFEGGGHARRLAGMFAAKEAAMKAFGNAGAAHFLDFEISHAVSGTPSLNQKALVSISHDERLAIAIVLAGV